MFFAGYRKAPNKAQKWPSSAHVLITESNSMYVAYRGKEHYTQC